MTVSIVNPGRIGVTISIGLDFDDRKRDINIDRVDAEEAGRGKTLPATAMVMLGRVREIGSLCTEAAHNTDASESICGMQTINGSLGVVRLNFSGNGLMAEASPCSTRLSESKEILYDRRVIRSFNSGNGALRPGEGNPGNEGTRCDQSRSRFE